MRIARVIGNVVLSRQHPSLDGGSLRLATPLTLEELRADAPGAAEPLVVWDDRGAGEGSLIAMSESGEAAQPFRPELKPVDAYNSAILDSVALDDDGA